MSQGRHQDAGTAQVIQTLDTRANITEQIAQVLAQRFAGLGIVPEAEQDALEAAVAAFALAGQALAEGWEAAADKAHPDLLEASLAAKAEVRGSAALLDQPRNLVGL